MASDPIVTVQQAAIFVEIHENGEDFTKKDLLIQRQTWLRVTGVTVGRMEKISGTVPSVLFTLCA